jgi:hypothetical protein
MKLQILCVTALLFCGGTINAAAQRPQLLPEPQSVEYGAGSLPIQGLVIDVGSQPTAEDRFAANELVRGLEEKTGIHLPVSETAPSNHAILLKRTGPVDALPVPGEKPGPDSREAYQLTVSSHGIQITGRSSAAVFYGVQTLLQLAEGRGKAAKFPDVTIRDWPPLAYRATLVDVGSEGPMSTVEQIKKQIDLLARYKGNQYFLYSEASIELDGYPLLNPQARFTKAEVRRIIAYARQRHIDVVPAVELFGHLHDLFRIEKYSGLADFPHGGEFDPANPKVKALLADWTAQLSDLFPSPFVDIGFDETFSIQKAAESAGAGATPVRLFLEQLRTVTNQFQSHGKHVMAYADIMVKFPEIISQLPPGLIALPWYYDPKPDPEYRHWLTPLVEHHVPHMVTSGVSSWNEVAPDFDTTFANIDTLLAAGRKSHTLGLVNTVWTDDGQVLLRMSWPGMAYGAAAAWQSKPMDRAGFFAAYSRQMYSPDVAEDVASAYSELNAAEQNLQAVFGPGTMAAVWKDPFAPVLIKQVTPHREDLRQCRLHAENAEEALYRALASGEHPEALRTMLVGARLLDYAGMKYLYALEIADAWAALPPNPTKEQLADTLHQGISSSVHSRTADLMDAIGQLRGDYRQQWLAEYTNYRLPTAMGRWRAELEYWRRAQARFGDLLMNFHDHDPLPPLEKLAGNSDVQ